VRSGGERLRHTTGEPPRRLVVTVNAEPDEGSRGQLIADAVTRLGPDVHTRITAAPAAGHGGGGPSASRNDRCRARFQARRHRPTPRGARALRDLKSLLKIGEVIRPDQPTTASRHRVVR
jgi:hypothetical protein